MGRENGAKQGSTAKQGGWGRSNEEGDKRPQGSEGGSHRDTGQNVPH